MTNLFRRSFVKSMFTSIVGFLGIGGASASVNNWAKMDNDESNDSVKEKVSPQTKPINKSEKVTGKFNPSSTRDHAISSIFSDNVKCEIKNNALYLKQGENTIIIKKNKVWKNFFGPLFEVVEPSVYITLNNDDTINNIWSPQNLAIGIAKRDENYELQTVEVKINYDIHHEDEKDGVVASNIYPYMPDKGINIVQKRYDSIDNIVRKKDIIPWEVCEYGWRISPSGPVKVKIDGKTYIICENKSRRFLVEWDEVKNIEKDVFNTLTLEDKLTFKNGEKLFKTPVFSKEMVERMIKNKNKPNSGLTI